MSACSSSSCPIVIPQGSTGPAGPAGGDGDDGAAILYNSCASPVTVATVGSHTLATYSTAGGEVAAGDILDVEALISIPRTVDSTFNFVFSVGTSFIWTESFVFSASGGSDGYSDATPPPDPSSTLSNTFIKVTGKILLKTISTQLILCDRLIFATSNIYNKAPMSASIDYTNPVTFSLAVNITTGTPSITCYYLTVTQSKKV